MNTFINQMPYNSETEYDPRKQFYSIMIKTETGFANIYQVIADSQLKVFYDTADHDIII